NRCNTLGMRVIPSQIKVLLLGAGGGGAAGAASKASTAVKGGSKTAKASSKAKPAAKGQNAKTTQASGKVPRKKSLREQYMGRTPGKSSRTGREVQDRMRKKGQLKEDPMTGQTI